MTAKTYTIHGLPELPEGYGPELEYGIPTRDSVVLNTLHGNRSGWTPPATFTYGLYAPKPKPWYPDEWYDPLTGELLPDVFEHEPGTWPKHCRPGECVEYLSVSEREKQHYYEYIYTRNAGVSWNLAVAYRVIRS